MIRTAQILKKQNDVKKIRTSLAPIKNELEKIYSEWDVTARKPGSERILYLEKEWNAGLNKIAEIKREIAIMRGETEAPEVRPWDKVRGEARLESFGVV
jgi:hypothetical protein